MGGFIINMKKEKMNKKNYQKLVDFIKKIENPQDIKKYNSKLQDYFTWRPIDPNYGDSTCCDGI